MFRNPIGKFGQHTQNIAHSDVLDFTKFIYSILSQISKNYTNSCIINFEINHLLCDQTMSVHKYIQDLIDLFIKCQEYIKVNVFVISGFLHFALRIQTVTYVLYMQYAPVFHKMSHTKWEHDGEEFESLP